MLMQLNFPTLSRKFKSLSCSLFVLIFAGFTISAVAQTPVSGTFTINSNLASSGNNFQTFTEAVFSLAYGVNGPVVFNVAPGSGPYQEQVNINAVPGTSATNTITFNGNGATLQNESTNSTSRAVLKLDGAKHVIINNLVIHPITTNVTGSYGWGIGIVRDADSNTIKKCTVNIGQGNSQEPQGNIGIFMGGTDDFPNSNGISNCDYNVIDSNLITGGYEAINLNNYGGNFAIDFTTMDYNQITNNTITGFINCGIYMIWNKGTLVQGNDISAATTQSTNAIQADEKNTLLKINGNRIHNISTTGASTDADFKAIQIVNCLSSANTVNTISNNAIYDIKNTNSQEGINVSGSAYVNVYHNTIVLNANAIPSGTTTSGFKHDAGNLNINFKNNLIVLGRTGTGSSYGINIVNAGTAFVSDYNDVLNTVGNYGRNGSSNYSTLAAWQTATSRDAHSTSTDPVFTNAATGNLKPTNVALDNLGLFTGIAFDINGDVRNNNNPDLGAYEFLTPACGAPVNGGTASAVPAIALCGGSLRTLNLAGNSFGSNQSYQWQSAVAATGPYSNVGSSLIVPVFDIFPTADRYYRAIVKCGAVADTSQPILIKIRNPMSGAYTINSALATDNNNFQKFADVLSALSCGIAGPVVLNVTPGSGPYNEQVILGDIAGVSSTNTVTIKGNGETLTYLSTSTNDRATIKLNGTDYLTVDSLVIIAQGSATGQYGIAVQVLNDADHNVFRNCKMTVATTSTSPNFAGFVIGGSDTDPIGGADSKCDFNKITGSTVTGGYYGIVLFSDPTVSKMNYDTVSNNIVRDQHQYSIYVKGNDHSLIEGNDISRPTRTITGSSYIALYLNSINTSLLISKNRIHNTHDLLPTSTDAPIAISSNSADATTGTENIISNNAIYNFGALGTLIGINNTSSDYNLYYHNTIALETTTGNPTTTARAFYQTTAAVGLQYRNNIVTVRRSGTGTNTGIYFNTAATTFVASNNDYVIAGTGTNKTGFKNALSYTTITDWQTGSGTETNSLSVDPIYTSLSSGNLYPTNAPLDNKGVATVITTDIINVPRSPATPDIGAYEFTGTIPVKLLSFAAAKSGNNVLVKWITASEQNTKQFVIERSVDAINFITVGTVQAIGNSSVNQYYNLTDLNALNTTAKVLYYRLKTIDLDGRFEYSVIIAIQFNNKELLVKVQPNPFVSELFASISTAVAGNVTIQLSDIAGRIITKQVQAVTVGSTLISIDKVSNLQKGIYLVKVELNGNSYVEKLD